MIMSNLSDIYKNSAFQLLSGVCKFISKFVDFSFLEQQILSLFSYFKMTDSKDDDCSGESNKEKNSNKKASPRFHSQLSNVSFGSFGGNEAGNGASGSTSPVNVTHLTSSTSFPRVSLRSLLMSSPFSRRTKPKRGCIINKSCKYLYLNINIVRIVIMLFQG